MLGVPEEVHVGRDAAGGKGLRDNTGASFESARIVRVSPVALVHQNLRRAEELHQCR